VGDGDGEDEDLCPFPVQVGQGLVIPKCMDMIRAEDVIRGIEIYCVGIALGETRKGCA